MHFPERPCLSQHAASQLFYSSVLYRALETHLMAIEYNRYMHQEAISPRKKRIRVDSVKAKKR